MKRRTFLKLLGLSAIAPKTIIDALEGVKAGGVAKYESIEYHVSTNIQCGDVVALVDGKIVKAQQNNNLVGVMTSNGIQKYGFAKVKIS